MKFFPELVKLLLRHAEHFSIPELMEYVNKEFILNLPKSQAGIREIPISREHLMVLKKNGESKEYQRRRKLAEGKKIRIGNGVGEATGKTDLSDFVFLDKIGTSYYGSILSRRMNSVVKAMKEAGKLDPEANYVFHSLRHSFATNAFQRGMNPKTVSEIMGHSDVRITLNRYCHETEESKRAAMKKSGMLDDHRGFFV